MYSEISHKKVRVCDHEKKLHSNFHPEPEERDGNFCLEFLVGFLEIAYSNFCF